MITVEIEVLRDIAAGEMLNIYANGLHIRISVSSPPALEDTQEVQLIGSDDLIADGTGDVDENFNR